MIDCKIVRLGEVVSFQEGPGVRNTQYTADGVKLLNVANLQNGYVDLSKSERYISENEAYGKYKHFLVDDGDLIIASSGIKVEYFEKKMGFVDKSHLPLCMNTSTIRFKALDKDVLNIRFFMYFLKSELFKLQLERQIVGSAQLNFGPSHLKRMNTIVPSLENQSKIVLELDKITDLISKRKDQLEKLDLLIKSKFHEMFGDPVANEMDWEMKKLNDICDVRDGTHDSPKYVDNGYPLITSKNVTNGYLDFNNVNYITEADLIKINQRSNVDNGDIIMPMIGTIGKPIIVFTDKIFAVKNVAIIKFNKTNILNIFVWAILASDTYKNRVFGNQQGGTQKFMALSTIRNINLIVPPIELQNQFADYVQKIEKTKEKMQAGLENLETLYKSRMQEYFG